MIIWILLVLALILAVLSLVPKLVGYRLDTIALILVIVWLLLSNSGAKL